MKANRAYHLIVSRGGLSPSFLTEGGRLDRIELVSIDDGEVVLYWQLPAKLAARMLREMRADLATLDAREFFEKWASVQEGF
ncbi:MAG TPA: hypothetical protein VFP55_09700 [Solirubrobacteraceae bacterium]|nr:hypothetical protein [Solirubrobacteraceae bacterium]